jgi:hypothetical protein
MGWRPAGLLREPSSDVDGGMDNGAIHKCRADAGLLREYLTSRSPGPSRTRPAARVFMPGPGPGRGSCRPVSRGDQLALARDLRGGGPFRLAVILLVPAPALVPLARWLAPCVRGDGGLEGAVLCVPGGYLACVSGEQGDTSGLRAGPRRRVLTCLAVMGYEPRLATARAAAAGCSSGCVIILAWGPAARGGLLGVNRPAGAHDHRVRADGLLPGGREHPPHLRRPPCPGRHAAGCRRAAARPHYGRPAASRRQPGPYCSFAGGPVGCPGLGAAG